MKLMPFSRKNSIGQEAVDALYKAIEINSNNLVVVLAGFPEKMDKFISANTNLKSKFSKYFKFDDYTNEQLIEIFDLFCQRSSFTLTESANKLVKKLLDEFYPSREEGFGNEREIRNIFECVVGNQANRIVSISEVTEEILCTITEDDIKPVIETLSKENSKSKD